MIDVLFVILGPVRRGTAARFGAISLSAVLACVCLFASNSPAAADSTCDNFSHYMLAQTWPETYCIDHGIDPCNHPAASGGWIIHGLWPEATEGHRYPERCAGPSFAENDIQDLLPQLEASWSDFGGEADVAKREDFWRHEWDKHGTCALACDAKVTSEHAYFALALDLAATYNVGKVLEDAGIKPSNQEVIALQTIEEALDKAYGASRIITCHHDKKTDTAYLTEIRLCIDAQNRDLIDCPASVVSHESNCPADVILMAPSG